MLLPNAEAAIIPPEKLRDYLLNAEHSANQGKVRIFLALGYSRQNWEVLEADIRRQHVVCDAVEIEPNEQGHRWQIDAPLVGLAGSATIRTGWIILFGESTPRFVTAYRVGK